MGNKGQSFMKGLIIRSGQILEWRQGRTGNLLLKRKMIDENGDVFAPEFGSGGEDQDFFRRMIAKGYVFKYCH